VRMKTYLRHTFSYSRDLILHINHSEFSSLGEQKQSFGKFCGFMLQNRFCSEENLSDYASGSSNCAHNDICPAWEAMGELLLEVQSLIEVHSGS